MNLAAEGRKAALANAARDIAMTSEAKGRAVQTRKQTRKKLNKRGKLGKVALNKGLQPIERRIKGTNRRADRLDERIASVSRRLGRAQDGVQVPSSITAAADVRGADATRLSERLTRLTTRRSELDQQLARLDKIAELYRRRQAATTQKKAASRSLRQLEGEYQSLIPGQGGNPLYYDALDIADQLGVDPVLAQALVGPNEDAQWTRSLEYGDKVRQPDLYADASALKVRPSDLDRIRRSAEWRETEAQISDWLASGRTAEQFEKRLRKALAPASIEAYAKAGFSRADVEMMVQLARRRYGSAFPTVTEVNRLDDYKAGL